MMVILLTSLLAIVGIFYANYSDRIKTIFFCITGINLFLLFLYFVVNNFSRAGINDAVFAHLHHLLNADVVLRFWPTALGLISALAIHIFTVVWLNKTSRTKKLNASPAFKKFATFSTPLPIIIGLVTNPLNIDLVDYFHQRNLNKQFPYPEHFEKIDDLAPEINYTSPQEKPNFVIIFAESLEQSFFNDEQYPELTPNLQSLVSAKGTEVRGIKQTLISAWTDAGLIAALCGIAMAPRYSDYGLTKSQITPQIIARTKATNITGETCLGDILAADGYNMTFIGGSDFGIEEKTIHFKSQGFKNILGTNDILATQLSPVPTSTWGSFDDALFDFAQQRIIQERDNPFGMVILTVDTHTPGYVAPSCRNNHYMDGGDQLLNAVHCSDKLISQFITDLLSKQEHKNTTIFLMSDHLYPGLLPNTEKKMEDRENLFVVFNSRLTNNETHHLIKRSATNLDIAPTILAHLGYNISTLNFGRNLMGQAPTLVETMGEETFSKHISKIRSKMDDHWKINNPTHTTQPLDKTLKSE